MTEPTLSSAGQSTQINLVCPRLPLAVYREVAAHIRQVAGIEAGLLPQRAQQFDYYQSQVGGLWIRYTSAADAISQRRVEQILSYYADRFGAWENLKG
ncbi:MAG TPA: hypothetical protein V6D10_15380 [Trichocoleus sp.]